MTGGVEEGAVGVDHLQEIQGPMLANLDHWRIDRVDGEPLPEPRSLLTMLLRALERNSQHESYPAIEKYLGLRDRGWRKHQFTMSMEVFRLLDLENKQLQALFDEVLKKVKKELADKIKEILEKAIEQQSKSTTLKRIHRAFKRFPLKTLIGFLTIKYEGVVERYDDGRTPLPIKDEPREATYLVLLGGFGLSRSVGDPISMKWKGTAHPWGSSASLPEELEGILQVSQADLFAGYTVKPYKGEAKKASAGGKVTVVTVFGTKHHQQQGVRFFLYDDEVGAKMKSFGIDAGFGMGASLTVLGGPMYLLTAKGAKLIVPTPEEEVKIRQEKRLVTRDALAAFAAYELPLLLNPYAVVEAIGHADMPDTEERNRKLAEHRALSVLHLLASFLSQKFLRGRSLEDLRSERLVRWRGEGESEQQKKGQTKEYDPRFRRVDLSVSLDDPSHEQASSIAETYEIRRERRPITKD